MNFNVLNEEKDIVEKNLLPEKADPFDPAPLIDLFQKYEKKIAGLSKQVDGIKVVDEKSNRSATEMITQAAGLKKAVNKKHREIKNKYLAVTQPLDRFRKKLSDLIQKIETKIELKIAPYLQKKEQERLQEERKAREEAARLQAEADLKAKVEAEKRAEEAREKAVAEGLDTEEVEKREQAAVATVEPAPVFVVDTASAVATKTVTDFGSVEQKKEWTFEIEDFKQVPNEIFERRRKEITKAIAPAIRVKIKDGVRHIPGVKIFQVSKIKTRTK